MLENLPITILDIIGLVIILVSAILATARGFSHEVLSIGAWAGAIAVAFFGFDIIRPFAHQMTDISLLADIGAALLLFLGSLVIFSLLSRSFAKHVKESTLGPLDRALGFLFGAVRGLFILCLAYVAATFVWNEPEIPEIAQQSRGYDFVRQVTESVMVYAPQSIQEKRSHAADSVRNSLENAQKAQELKEYLNNPAPSGKNQSQDQSGYNDEDRNTLESIIRDSE